MNDYRIFSKFSRLLFKKVTAFLFFILITCSGSQGQPVDSSFPRIINEGGRHALMVDDKPYFILGGQVHNSSAWPAMMPKVWTAIETLHANTLEIPVYWEQVEPVQGNFDFSVVDTLLSQAREHNVRLVLLWFATWKNGSNHYMPEWMKKEPDKYPDIVAKNGKQVDSPSPHSLPAMEADTKAFVKLMEHLKRSDPRHTVIMVQIENEPGSWYSVRDYSKEAQKLFESQVPMALLKPDVLKALHKTTVSKGTWPEVFGDDADEYFEAWHVARYIENIAQAGKEVYPLPFYVNAALRIPFGNPRPSTYESGGPTDNVIPVWKAAAPSIDLLAPDIYLSGTDTVQEVLKLYSRSDNALFVPEIRFSDDYVKYLYEVLARGGIGFSPFGIDDNTFGENKKETPVRLAPFTQEYAMLFPMIDEMAGWSFEGKISTAIAKDGLGSQTIDLGDWQAVAEFHTGRRPGLPGNMKRNGKVMIVQSGRDEFIAAGTSCRITFRPVGKNAGKQWQYLKVEEGYYKNGNFNVLRILNGDETDWGGPYFSDKPVVLRIKLITR